ncbi:exo-beta-N-acetylmuramidase NamZ family protein [Aquimarina muelleri]|uniref:DUF1343 domain-containing protein n=1 Tax=Aquimarina muelleri TaxID=279356 RepID=A0A918JTE6_9FLAO|nr:DUF1343 domain-containing protein [Aquimarina muelleri]MCX2761859.1 DUF1343 domain-containing protein [Aquimarina muelleri]GGX09915.1 hypothetical protein GCM10007384_09500 [Aquimarina muelleri]
MIFISCVNGIKSNSPTSSLEIKKHISPPYSIQDTIKTVKPIVVGANITSMYIPFLENKKVAIVGNQTSVIFRDSITNQNYVHLVDSLLSRNIKIKKVFAPEHGFRGKADAGELVANGKDIKTGLPIISLYGKDKKPSKEALSNIDIVVFDIQDVGVRFYTYISTLHYVMQACAENNIPVLILDRPNPNAHYIDGPTLEPEHSSFVGVHPIPLVHAMTIGEYAKMINGEGWLGAKLKCEIQIIPVKNYTHNISYSLPIRPSPNLPNDTSINLYPSLGFLEGTTINAGRGTEMQFQIFGSPDLSIKKYDYAYTPKPNFGSKHPKHEGKTCYGKDLRNIKPLDSINLEWLVNAYNNSNTKEKFFNTESFTIHAGTKKLEQQIKQGLSPQEIKSTWHKDLQKFKTIRKKYLLYN